MRLRFANNGASVLGGKNAQKKIVGRTYVLPTIFWFYPEHFTPKTVEPIFFWIDGLNGVFRNFSFKPIIDLCSIRPT